MLDFIPFTTSEPSIFDYLDRQFNVPQTAAFAQCKTDIGEAKNAFILSADLPGFEKEDIAIDVKDSILTITAKHNNAKKEEKDCSKEAPSQAEDQTKDAAKQTDEEVIHYIRKERNQYNYKRSFNIDGIDASKISASYTNGVLEITLPKLQPKEPEHINIHVA